MKKIITSLCLFIIVLTNAQYTNFEKGFDRGYKEGFCYQKSLNCIEPISPIAPIPNINENRSSYKDGYQRGFLSGQSKSQSETYSNSPTYTPRRRNTENDWTDLNSAQDQKLEMLRRQQSKSYNNTQNQYYSSPSTKAKEEEVSVPKRTLKVWYNSIVGIKKFEVYSKVGDKYSLIDVQYPDKMSFYIDKEELIIFFNNIPTDKKYSLDQSGNSENEPKSLYNDGVIMIDAKFKFVYIKGKNSLIVYTIG